MGHLVLQRILCVLQEFYPLADLFDTKEPDEAEQDGGDDEPST